MDWKKNLRTRDDKLIDFVLKLMVYSPKKRLNAIEAMAHPYFDELRDESRFSDIEKKIGRFPDPFNFSKCTYVVEF